MFTEKPKKLGALANSFLESRVHRKIAPKTYSSYARALRELQDAIGDAPIEELTPRNIKRFLAPYNAPTANAHRAALRAMSNWAVGEEEIPHDFMCGVERRETDGAREPWTAEQVILAEQYARPDLARLVTLAVNTGQRLGDLVAMQWNHIERDRQGHDWIRLQTRKTKLPLFVPVLPPLAKAFAQWDRSSIFICVDRYGRPWDPERTVEISRDWNYERRTNQHLESLRGKGLSFHGLRATAVGRLRKAGMSALGIASTIGMSEQMVARYTRKEDKRDLSNADLERAGLWGENVIQLNSTPRREA